MLDHCSGQWGTHDDKGIRKSYGHSLIIDPWGVVRSDCGQGWYGLCRNRPRLHRLS